jgi:ketosteroid isomerase-like protein
MNRAFDALERGDLDEFTELIRDQIHPDCEFRSGIGSVVGGGTYKGFEGVRGWFADVLATTSQRRWRNRQWEVVGDEVAVFLADLSFTGAASGATVSSETGAVSEWENGLCVRMTSFMSHDEAREFAQAHVA